LLVADAAPGAVGRRRTLLPLLHHPWSL